MADPVPVSTLNRVRYAGLDFDTHMDDLRARMQVKFAADYNDFALTSLAMMLLDVVAFGLDTLSFYLDRRATEVYLSTARTRRGVARISRQLGYKMAGAVASSTDLSVSIRVVKPFNIVIPVGFKWNGPNGLTFETAKAVTWTPVEQQNQVVKPVPVFEGETTSETFTSDGSPNQVFVLRRVPDGKFLASGSVSVTVDGAPWKEEDFLTYQKTDQFEVGYNDDPATLRFGNATAGNIPKKAATIKVTYIATSGKAGLASSNTITKETAPLVVVGQTIQLVVAQPNKASGGDDWETLEQAIASAGRVFKSRRVAITQPDYDALAGSYAHPVYGRVAVAQAIATHSAANDMQLANQLADVRRTYAGATSAFDAMVLLATDTTPVSVGSPVQTGYLPAIDYFLTQMLDSLTTISVTDATQIVASCDALSAGLRSSKDITYSPDAEADAGIATTAASAAITADKNKITANFNAVKSAMATLRSNIDGQLATANQARGYAQDIGVSLTALKPDGSSSEIAKVATARQEIVSRVGVAATPTGLYAIFLESTAVTGLAYWAAEWDVSTAPPGTSGSTVSDALAAIYSHVDRFLSLDCKANLVTVPILTRDSAGFYTEPSNGLIQTLQNYLEARKEVTQVVEVVSGGYFLLYPRITVRVGVKQGYSQDQVKAAVSTAIDGVLRNRRFGVSLYVSDFDLIRQVAGVGFMNLTIVGSTDITDLWPYTQNASVSTTLLDPSGNLIISASQVITKGPSSTTVTSVTVETELAPTT